jgi:2'-5' RNA ligase
MRLFVALDLSDSIREKITQFMNGVREFIPDARWVNQNHFTLL